MGNSDSTAATPTYSGPAQEWDALRGPLNAFAGRITAGIFKRHPGKNVFLSPLSISSAMALARTGAGSGTTLRELNAVLGDCAHSDNAATISANENRTHQLYRALYKALQEAHKAEFNVANAVFVKDKIAQEYLARVERGLGAGAYPLTTEAPINEYVETNTKNLIKDLLPVGSIDPDTRAILINAVYFKGQWNDEFEKSYTQEGADFHVAADKVVPCNMMYKNQDDWSYFEDDTYQAVRIPYTEGSGFHAQVVLPRKGKTVDTVLEKICAKQFRHPFGTRKGSVYLPRFKLEFGTESLKQDLQALGISQAFKDTANFKRMTAEDVYIEDVLHKAMVEVDEAGTVAAAATAVVMTLESCVVDRGPRPFTLRADREFIFLIEYKGLITFVGKVAEPK